jgi:hypothetical protein
MLRNGVAQWIGTGWRNQSDCHGGIARNTQVGERIKMKYYSSGEAYPDGIGETTIKEISKEEQGRFKGHFLVDLEPLQ